MTNFKDLLIDTDEGSFAAQARQFLGATPQRLAQATDALAIDNSRYLDHRQQDEHHDYQNPYKEETEDKVLSNSQAAEHFGKAAAEQAKKGEAQKAGAIAKKAAHYAHEAEPEKRETDDEWSDEAREKAAAARRGAKMNPVHRNSSNYLQHSSNYDPKEYPALKRSATRWENKRYERAIKAGTAEPIKKREEKADDAIPNAPSYRDYRVKAQDCPGNMGQPCGKQDQVVGVVPEHLEDEGGFSNAKKEEYVSEAGKETLKKKLAKPPAKDGVQLTKEQQAALPPKMREFRPTKGVVGVKLTPEQKKEMQATYENWEAEQKANQGMKGYPGKKKQDDDDLIAQHLAPTGQVGEHHQERNWRPMPEVIATLPEEQQAAFKDAYKQWANRHGLSQHAADEPFGNLKGEDLSEFEFEDLRNLLTSFFREESQEQEHKPWAEYEPTEAERAERMLSGDSDYIPREESSEQHAGAGVDAYGDKSARYEVRVASLMKAGKTRAEAEAEVKRLYPVLASADSKAKDAPEKHIHTAKGRRCVEEVKKKGGAVNPYAVCSSSMGSEFIK